MEPNFFNNSELLLLRKDGSAVRAIDVLRDVDYVLMYFSAHWCPPCRNFTPVLKTFYEAHHAKKNFEIVFLSMDESEDQMMSYFRQSHGDYYCLPYSDAKSMARVWGDSYNFRTIPTLLVFENADPRKVITRFGREMVVQDPAAATFPWPDADAMQPKWGPLLDYARPVLMVIAVLFLLYSMLTRSS